MQKKFILVSLLTFLTLLASGQTYTFSGKVLSQKSHQPVEYATVILESTSQWAVADDKGNFTIKNVQGGKNVVSISCIGYATDTKEIEISRDIENYKIYLAEDNLALEGVVITAKEKDNSATTNRMIDKTALEHIQMMNLTDVSCLLPGGRTTNPSLLGDQQFNIRAGDKRMGERGSASFGTAVEVDGVRLSNNASFSTFSNTSSGAKGVSTNNIASTNVESIEVITGVPSVEYGDMSSGIVKINTRKGKTPYIITMSTNPSSKQISASKGFSLGKSRSGASNGVLNANIEYTKDISSKMSPYTAYDRKQLSLSYSNTFNHGILSDMPLQFSFGATGNLGGMDSQSDPDAFKDTFQKKKDDAIRGNFSFDWLLSKSWITNLEFSGSIVYSNRNEQERKYYATSASSASIHGRNEGYFVAQDYAENPDAAVTLIPNGYWYNTLCIDDRPLNWKLALKANWARQWGKVNNKVKIGADWSGDGNFGIGMYSDDMATAPSFWEYRYNEVPFMNNIAAYIEDNVMIQMGSTRLNLIAGLRNDNTLIKGSAYGTTSSLSPRFNAKYTIIDPKVSYDKVVRSLAVRASWGVAVKMPSFSILFPEPTYRSLQTFTPQSGSDGSSYMAYYISPRTTLYNPDLKWQRNRQSEIGVDIDLAGNHISLAAFYNKTMDAYYMQSVYSPFSYNYTSAEALQQNCTIPVDNRKYEVNQTTGQVTVFDKTGSMSPQMIPYAVKNGFDGRSVAANDKGTITRYGLEWTVDFKRIEAINTTFRLDGSYYGYRAVDTNLIPYSPYTGMGYDGEPYKYVAIYYGGELQQNGTENQTLNTNLTVTTHIPRVRLILSVKLEASLMRYTRNLSERADGSDRSHALSDRNDILSLLGKSIYDEDNFAVTFPDFVVSLDEIQANPNLVNQIISNPEKYQDYAYLPKLKEAKKSSNSQMYSDLSRLAETSDFIWYYGKNHISPFFSANISVTKEIGDIASLSFYANNFFNNMSQVKSSQSGTYSSVDLYIPTFYYGLSLRLKF